MEVILKIEKKDLYHIESSSAIALKVIPLPLYKIIRGSFGELTRALF